MSRIIFGSRLYRRAGACVNLGIRIFTKVVRAVGRGDLPHVKSFNRPPWHGSCMGGRLMNGRLFWLGLAIMLLRRGEWFPGQSKRGTLMSNEKTAVKAPAKPKAPSKKELLRNIESMTGHGLDIKALERTSVANINAILILLKEKAA